MKKQDGNLFKIGEVCKILGITRKTLLVYEEAGILTPAVKDSDSGFRYYTADNMSFIRSIRSLQSMGFSLKEIAEYVDDAKSIDKHLQNMLELRALLDKNIRTLQTRSAKRGDLTVHSTILPREVCYCRRYQCRNTADSTNSLRETYIAAARTGKMSPSARLFSLRVNPDPSSMEFMFCITMEDDYAGPERVELAETNALCIYHRGPYEEIPDVIRALTAHIKENNIQTAGPFRSIFLEGPPSRGDNSEDYITVVAVPIS